MCWQRYECHTTESWSCDVCEALLRGAAEAAVANASTDYRIDSMMILSSRTTSAISFLD